MEASGCAGNADPAKRAGKAVKWAFVIGLAVAAAVIGFLTIFRTHPAQTTVREAMAAVEQGDAEALMSHVDPEGDLGRLWTENTQGARDAILDALERYRVEFSSPRFATRAEGSAAEVALKGGRVTVYRRGGEESTLAVFDLEVEVSRYDICHPSGLFDVAEARDHLIVQDCAFRGYLFHQFDGYCAIGMDFCVFLNLFMHSFHIHHDEGFPLHSALKADSGGSL